ncbi:carbonic anhydrase [Bacteroidota bacterium]
MALGKTFSTAINCMDGRTQIPVNEYLSKKYQVDYVDTITEPGPIKYLAEQSDKFKLKSILERIDISVYKHGSKSIAVVGHFDCAGNPIGKAEQMVQVKKSCVFLKEKYPGVEVIGVWVDENWEVEEV